MWQAQEEIYMHYRIRVKGHLDSSWQAWFDALQTEHEWISKELLFCLSPITQVTNPKRSIR
jgi:hypothetical protein